MMQLLERPLFPHSKFEMNENPRSVVFSPDGKFVALGGHALRLWNVQTGEEVPNFGRHISLSDPSRLPTLQLLRTIQQISVSCH